MKHLHLIALLLMCLCGCEGDDNPSFDEVVSLVNQGDYERALSQSQTLLALDSLNPEIYRLRTEVFLTIGQPKNALVDVTKAIELTDSDDLELFSLLGNSLFQLNRPEEALNAFLLVFFDDSTGGSVNYNIGLCYNSLNRFEESIPYLKREIRLNPKEPNSYGVLGESYQLMGMHNKAIETLLTGAELEEDVRTYVSLGVSYFNLSEFDSSTYYYERALELDPMDPDLYERRASAYWQLGVYDSALNDCNKAISLGGSVDAYLIRGNVYKAYEQLDRACEDYRRAYSDSLPLDLEKICAKEK
jgi:tetratricopeptide (TPR) repeat protein